MMLNTPPIPGQYRKIFKPSIRKILAVLALVLVIWGLFLGYHVYDLAHVAGEIRQQKKIELNYDWGGAIHHINGDVHAIQRSLSPFLFVFRLLPDGAGAGHYFRQVDLFSRYAVELVDCAKALFDGVQPAIGILQDQATSADTEAIIAVLSSQTAAFQQAGEYYQNAVKIKPSLDPGVLPPSIKQYYDKFDTNFAWLGFGVEMLQALPDMAGQNQSKTYLLLAQNNDEIRASGGFISGIGTIELAGGKIKNFELGDSYAVDDLSKDYPWPPMPIQRFMLGEYWLTRDGNWSPDFPTAAKQIQDLYFLSTAKKTDGVVAFDQETVKRLIAIFGPLQVTSLDAPVTADNVEQYMHDAWAPDSSAALNSQWWLHRKDFMKELGSKLLNAILGSRNIDRWITVAGTIKDLVQSGHLLVYFNTPEIQSVISSMDLAGVVNFGNDPTFMLVDSNIGFNKMDGVVTRTIDIHMDLSDLSQPVATITVYYQNPVKKAVICKHVASYGDGTYTDMQNRCYWDYFRIYLPSESQLISISTPEIPPEWLLDHETVHNPVEVSKGEGESLFIGGMMVVPANTQQQIVLNVRLPQAIVTTDVNEQKVLALKVYKQPGLRSLPINLSVILPQNYTTCQGSDLQPDKSNHQISWKVVTNQTYEQKICLSATH